MHFLSPGNLWNLVFASRIKQNLMSVRNLLSKLIPQCLWYLSRHLLTLATSERHVSEMTCYQAHREGKGESFPGPRDVWRAPPSL